VGSTIASLSQFGNQIGPTEETLLNPLDDNACSGPFQPTAKTEWTTQTGLRSRWRRFESCRGRIFSQVRFCVPTFGREEERLGAPGFAHVTEPVDLPPFVPGRWNEVLVTAVD
jgi:hypothetical protein